VSRRVIHLFVFAIALACALSPTQAKAAATFHHGFHVPNYAEPGQTSMGDSLAGQVGSDTIRMHYYWSNYQTGVNQYNQAFLQGIVERVQAARNNSGNPSLKALINFDLPTQNIPWMAAAGYNLIHTGTGGAPRYYPFSRIGQEAYAQAMAKALKYLYNAGVAEFIETPNEPNLVNGPSEAVPPDQIGALGAYAVTYAAVEGLQLNPNTGPAILVGSVSTGQASGSSQFYNEWSPEKYFGEVQWWTDWLLAFWWENVPGGPSYAYTLSGTWRPSFHSYPKLGGAETEPCGIVPTTASRQDELGDRTGLDAYNSVINKLIPALSVITNSKKWWITETGMTSYKTNVSGESYKACIERRERGGSSYGKTAQSDFYGDFVYYMNYMKANSGFPWSRFEGAAFFLPHDVNYAGSPFAGFGVHWPSGSPNCTLGYPCRKPAATTFLTYY
jgi:hypothetical protein